MSGYRIKQSSGVWFADIDEQTLWTPSGSAVDLTGREAQLLRLLCQVESVTRDAWSMACFGHRYRDHDRTLDNYVSRLRGYGLGIATRYGQGYQLKGSVSAEAEPVVGPEADTQIAPARTNASQTVTRAVSIVAADDSWVFVPDSRRLFGTEHPVELNEKQAAILLFCCQPGVDGRVDWRKLVVWDGTTAGVLSRSEFRAHVMQLQFLGLPMTALGEDEFRLDAEIRNIEPRDITPMLRSRPIHPLLNKHVEVLERWHANDNRCAIERRLHPLVAELKAGETDLVRLHSIWQGHHSQIYRYAKLPFPVMPVPSARELAEQAGMEGRVHIIDVSRWNPGDYVIESYGAQSISNRGRDLTNHRVGDFPLKLHADGLQTDYSTVKMLGLPRLQTVFSEHYMDPVQYSRLSRYQLYSRLILPISTNGKSVDRLIVGIRYEHDRAHVLAG